MVSRRTAQAICSLVAAAGRRNGPGQSGKMSHPAQLFPRGSRRASSKFALLTQILIRISSSILRHALESKQKAATARFLTSAGLRTSKSGRRKSTLANPFLTINAGKNCPGESWQLFIAISLTDSESAGGVRKERHSCWRNIGIACIDPDRRILNACNHRLQHS